MIRATQPKATLVTLIMVFAMVLTPFDASGEAILSKSTNENFS